MLPDSSEAHAEFVREILPETADACSVVLDPPDDAGDKFDYRPGQFLTLRLPCGSGAVARCYSLCSSPHVDDSMRVAVKRVATGLASNWINDALQPGDLLDCLVPAGVFTPKTFDEDFLLFAGGSGITPVISILKTALTTTGRHVRLLYANRDAGSVIFARELDGLARDYAARLAIVHRHDDVHGFVDARAVQTISLTSCTRLARPGFPRV